LPIPDFFDSSSSGLANRTFDQFATLFEVYKCTTDAAKKPAVPGTPGALVERWFHVDRGAVGQGGRSPLLAKFFHDEHPQYTATLAGILDLGLR